MEQGGTRMQQEEEKQKLLPLRGGVRGKFLRTVSVLQDEIETIRSTEAGAKNPAQYVTLMPLFENIQGQIQSVERFGIRAAETALGSMLRRSINPRTLNLQKYLKKFKDFYLEELSLYSMVGRLDEEEKESDELTVKVDSACLCSMQVNLLCGILQINPEADGSFYCTKNYHLIYHDSSSRLSEEQQALLEEGMIYKEKLSKAELSLLLVHAYAEEIGWKVTVEQGSGLTVDFAILNALEELDTLELCSESAVRKLGPNEDEECRTMIRQKFVTAEWKREI